MKISLRRPADDRQQVELHFERRLPTFPVRKRRVGPFVFDETTIDGRQPLPAIAERMATLTRGQIDTEVVAPARTFLEMLERLLFEVPGVISLAQLDAYGLSVRIGRCFDPKQVAAEVAAVIAHLLWPDESFELIESEHEPAVDDYCI